MRNGLIKAPLAVGTLAAILYLALPSAKYHPDGIANIAAFVENFGERPIADWIAICLPGHLLFDFLALVCWKILLALGYEGRALGPLTAIFSLVAAIGVGFFAAALQRLTDSRLAGVICGLGLAVSSGYWMYANNLEDILTSLTLFLAAFWLSVVGTTSRKKGIWLVAGVILGLSVLAHNTSITLVPVLACLALSTKENRVKQLVRLGLGFLVPMLLAVGLIGGVYGRFNGLGSLGDWIFYTMNLGIWGGSDWQLETLLGSMMRLLVWQGESLKIVAGISAIVLMIGAIIRAVKDRNGLIVPVWSIALALFLWIAPTVLFAGFWNASDPEFLVPVVPAIWIMLALGFNSRPGRKIYSGLVTALVFLLLTVNLFFTAIPDNDRNNNQELVNIELLKEHTALSDLLITPSFGWTAVSASYFTELEVLGLLQLQLATRPTGLVEFSRQLDDAIKSALMQNRSVWLFTNPEQDGAWWQVFDASGGDRQSINNVLAKYAINEAFVIDEKRFYSISPSGID